MVTSHTAALQQAHHSLRSNLAPGVPSTLGFHLTVCRAFLLLKRKPQHNWYLSLKKKKNTLIICHPLAATPAASDGIYCVYYVVPKSVRECLIIHESDASNWGICVPAMHNEPLLFFKSQSRQNQTLPSPRYQLSTHPASLSSQDSV